MPTDPAYVFNGSLKDWQNPQAGTLPALKIGSHCSGTGVYTVPLLADFALPARRWSFLSGIACARLNAFQKPARKNIDGADGRTRTGTAFATAPSRQRVYQFHHIGAAKILFRSTPETRQ
jgi:hypothetical protein